MFQDKLQKRMDLLDQNLVLISESEAHLTEKGEGEADLTLHLQNPCILFRGLEDHKLGYFKNQKCADYALFECRCGQWSVHIFELKRTMSESNWKQTKEQFKGAMQNMLALAGFLGIQVDLERVNVYSVFRNDKIKDFSSPVRQRLKMHRRENITDSKECLDWESQEIELDFLGRHTYPHRKVSLDIAHGTGEYAVGQC